MRREKSEVAASVGLVLSAGQIWFSSLPLNAGLQPSWIRRADALVIDERKKAVDKAPSGGMLLATVVSVDSHGQWGNAGVRPPWLRSMLAANLAHVQAHGHAWVIRWQPTQPQLTTWQKQACDTTRIDDGDCTRRHESDNLGWEKGLMMKEYLQSPQMFSHVLVMDADAVFVHRGHDSMTRMARILDEEKKDVFVANEDWLKYGEGRLNAGVILASNSDFSRKLFGDLWECHQSLELPHPVTLEDGAASCGSTAPIALNEWKGRRGVQERIHLASGRTWNRGGETLFTKSPMHRDDRMFMSGIKDPELEIIHFMGTDKHSATSQVCQLIADSKFPQEFCQLT